jgi:AraC-like DNA-binding protein
VSPGAIRQTFVERPPTAPLADLVASAWVQQITPDGESYTHRNTPNGGVEVVCAVGGMPRVIGPRTGPLVDVLAPGTTVVGVRFHPGAASSLLGVPASELVDLALDPEDLWGRSAAALGETVDAAVSPESALAALEEHLARRAMGASAPDPLVAEVVRQLRWGTDDVGSIRSALYISERQLRRRFLAGVGVGPKTLHRALRFQRFLALAQHAIAHGVAPTEIGLAMLAAEAGYADQPHLSRECLRLTGLSPRAFLGEIEHKCGPAHDHAAWVAPLLRSRPRMAVPFKPASAGRPYGRAHVRVPPQSLDRDARRRRSR